MPEAPEPFPAEALQAVFGAASGTPQQPPHAAGVAGTPVQWRQFYDICRRIQGFPRHLSIHVGGMLVTGESLIDMLPVERATMPGRVVVQFNKDDVEDLGLIKMDMLGLRTLSVVEECQQLVAQEGCARPNLDALDLKDPEVYRIATEADTVGVFQIESRAQMQTLPRTRPECFNDLVVEVAIIRPGPIQGNAVNPYIRRRQGREPVTYAHPALEPILRDTLGVILFQEQILEIAIKLGGYTPTQADGFRRAMDRHRHPHEMEALRTGFLEATKRTSGVDEGLGSEIFKAISGFAEFGFCRCLGGETRISDPLSGRIATLQELADVHDFNAWRGGTLLAPPVTSVLSCARDGRLTLGTIGAVRRNGVRRTYRVLSQSGGSIVATGNHRFLTPQGYRELDDLAPGCEVAMQWTDDDVYWDHIEAIEEAGEQETFDLTVEPHHNFVANGFVVHNSHAAAFARTTYETVWLKQRFPAAYYSALLNNQPMGFYQPAVLVEDAKRHGVEVLPVDINKSRERCLPVSRRDVDGDPRWDAMRLGFNYVHGIGVGALETLKRERERGEFKDLQDFCDRVCVREAEPASFPPALREASLSPPTGAAADALGQSGVADRPPSTQVRRGHPGTSLNPAEPAPLTPVAVENLVLIGAFDFLGKPRRQLLWEVKEAFAGAGKTRLVRPVVETLPLPEMTELERTSTDYRVMALTTGRHLVSYYRDQLDELQVTDSRALKDVPDGARIKVAGLVITRQAPGTAKRFRFFTLEDEWGHINIILRPDFFARHRKVANQNQMLFFEGVVQHQDGVISVLAEDVRALSLLPDTAPRSRDFR